MKILLIILLSFSGFGSWGTAKDRLKQSFEQDVEQMLTTMRNQSNNLKRKFNKIVDMVEMVAEDHDAEIERLKQQLRNCQSR